MTHEDADEDERSDRPGPVVVDPDALAPATLRGLVEAFVLREGTDYGLREVHLEEKVRDVMRQLDRGEARIVFDPDTESVDIQPLQGLRDARRSPPGGD